MSAAVYVVGGGLFGSIAALVCRNAGMNVTVFDDGRTGAGSKAAGCVIKQEWIQSLGKEKAELGLELLNDLYGLRELQFKTRKGATSGFVLAPERVFVDSIPRQVAAVGDGWVEADGETLEGTVLVAAGVWSRALVKAMPPIRALCDSSFVFRGDQGAGIHVYAPYKQNVWFPRGDGTWFGDGTAILKENYGESMNERTLRRAEYCGLSDPVSMTWGMRPYIAPGGYLERFGKRLWVSSGGAMNGCLLAAVQADSFVKAIA